MYAQILSGLVGGVVIGISGFGKSEGETLDLVKLGTTVIVSGIIGAGAGALGMDYGVLANGTLAAGLAVIVENIFKTVNRRLIVPCKAKKK
jgi:hypothetical protein